MRAKVGRSGATVLRKAPTVSYYGPAGATIVVLLAKLFLFSQ
jgi:hypothetical protein